MSKIGEKVHYDEQEDRLIIEQKHDFNPILEKTKQLRNAGATDYGDSKLVGMIPMKLWAEWGKKWGVSPTDNEGMKDVVAKELADPDNAHFRVWGGTY